LELHKLPILKRLQGVQPDQYPNMMQELDYIDKRPVIVKVLADEIRSKKPVLEILVKDSGFTYDSQMHLLFDKGARVKTLGEFLESEYGIRRGTVKCTECHEPIETDILFYHLQDNYHNGHKLGIQKVIDFLATISN